MSAQNKESESSKVRKTLYIKGGNAVEEGDNLIPQRGKILKGGPDQFLLAVLSIVNEDDSLRVVTFGKEKKAKVIGGVEFVEYALRKPNQTKLLKAYNFLSALLSFTITTLKYKPEIVICGLDGPVGLVAMICAKLCSSKYVFSVHNALNLPQISWVYRFCNKILARYAEHIIVHGEFLSDQVSSYGVKKTRIFEYASTIDDEELTFIQKQKNRVASNKPNNKTILFIGRMEQDKGVYDLLEAFCSAKLDGVELVYIGDGDSLSNIREKVRNSQIANVRFMGQVQYDQIFEYLCAATLLVTPTQSSFPEGRCKSIVEAFIAGVPVIAPNFGPFPYLVKHKLNGLIYQADNVKELTIAIQDAMEYPDFLSKLAVGAAKSGESLLNSLSFRTVLNDVLKK